MWKIKKAVVISIRNREHGLVRLWINIRSREYALVRLWNSIRNRE